MQYMTSETTRLLQDLKDGSSHIQSVLIGVEYRNFCRTLDVYLLFTILCGQIK
jgi:hypothetical protein